MVTENLSVYNEGPINYGRRSSDVVLLPPFEMPYYFSRIGEIMLGFENLDNIQRAADDLAKGLVIIANMCGAIGFVIDGTNQNAIDRVLEIKGRSKEESPLVIGGSLATRLRLIDEGRIAEVCQVTDGSVYDLPHFFEYPVKADLVPDGIGKTHPRFGRVGVLFWANYYLPILTLESALQARNRQGFLAGSSANLHDQPPVRNSKEAYDSFGNGEHSVARILVDSRFESEKPFSGSHAMLGVDENDGITPYRGGSITLRSYQSTYPGLKIPAGWQDPADSVYVDVNEVRIAAAYLRSR